MDESTNTDINESGAIETNTPDVETNVSDEVKTDKVTTEETEQQTNEISEQNETQPEKIKLGEKEYSPDEIQEALKFKETQQAEAEKNQYQPRELTVIETELKREVNNFEADAVNIKKNFIAKATPPIVEQVNPETNLMEQYYAYSAEDAFNNGIKTGNWKEFIKCLNPEDAIEFQLARDKFASEYQQKVGKLEQEKGYIQAVEAKKADVAKWDNYIGTNQSPAEKHLLNGLKNKYNFDEKGIQEFLTLFRQAKALEQNKSDLNTDTENAKNLMMNSTVTGGAKPEGGNKIFTREEIGKMSDKDFAKYEKIIDEQYRKGLIK